MALDAAASGIDSKGLKSNDELELREQGSARK
jgi:hypothetical protein